MMNKLTKLFAMILGLALVVPTVDAAGRRTTRRKAAPVVDVTVVVDDTLVVDAPAVVDATPSFFARRKQNLVDAQAWAKAHPYKATGITVGTVAAIVVVAEAAKNGKNSLFPKLYRKFAGKNAQHNRLADVLKAKEAALAN